MRELLWLAPEITLAGYLVLFFVIDGFFPAIRDSRKLLWLGLLGVLTAFVLTLRQENPFTLLLFSNSLVIDGLSVFFRLLLLPTLGGVLLLLHHAEQFDAKARSEFQILLFLGTLGALVMALSQHLFTTFLGIELVSLVSYVLVAGQRHLRHAAEAAVKYFVFGALSAGIFAYGLSLVYGSCGSLLYPEVFRALAQNWLALGPALKLALVLVLAGVLFKAAAFPMHFWAPDAYESAPTWGTGFLALVPKLGAIAILYRFLSAAELSPAADTLKQALVLVSVGTLTIGNFAALLQTDLKRLLAYSGIAQIGYLLMGFVVGSDQGQQAAIFYTLAYAAMTLGAFVGALALENLTGSTRLERFRGLGWRYPVLGVCMAVFFFSLAGLPAFSGFVGKFLLFGAVIEHKEFTWLAVFGVLNSVISLYYYAQVLRVLWLDKPLEAPGVLGEERAHRLPRVFEVLLVGLSIPTIALGVYFTPALRVIAKVVLGLSGHALTF